MEVILSKDDKLFDYERGKDDGRKQGRALFSGWGKSDAYKKGRAIGDVEHEEEIARQRQERDEAAKKSEAERLEDQGRRAEEERRAREADARSERADRLMDRLQARALTDEKVRAKEDQLLEEMKRTRPDSVEIIALELEIMRRRAAFDDDWEEDFQRVIAMDESES